LDTEFVITLLYCVCCKDGASDEVLISSAGAWDSRWAEPGQFLGCLPNPNLADSSSYPEVVHVDRCQREMCRFRGKVEEGKHRCSVRLIYQLFLTAWSKISTWEVVVKIKPQLGRKKKLWELFKRQLTEHFPE
jgi:hypothetical protein